MFIIFNQPDPTQVFSASSRDNKIGDTVLIQESQIKDKRQEKLKIFQILNK